MTAASSAREWIAAAENDATVEALAYDRWLRLLGRLNFVTVLLPAVCSTVAAVIAAFWPSIAAALSAIAAIAITIHKTLKCEEHQAECRRLTQGYRAFAVAARAALALPEEKLQPEFDQLAMQLVTLTEGAIATVPESYRARAAADLGAERGPVATVAP